MAAGSPLDPPAYRQCAATTLLQPSAELLPGWFQPLCNPENPGSSRHNLSRCPCVDTQCIPSSLHQRSLIPACFSILLNVPSGISLRGDGTVTRPGRVGCLNCLWLPDCATSTQPSCLKRLMISRLSTVARSPVLL